MAWARAVKSRRKGRGGPPPLWLFTDAVRLVDPRNVVRRLPVGLAGVVLRHDQDPDRAALGRDLAVLCRARRLGLTVAGDWRLAARLRAGLHARDGRRPGAGPSKWPIMTASAHDVAAVIRARRIGADLAFLSPVFATASHPGAAPLGPPRWAALAYRCGSGVAALGGLSGHTVRRLPRSCAGIGAISALR